MQKSFSLFLFCLFLMNTAIGQTENLDLTLKRLGEYENKYPKEKVYLHLDRSYYSPGDDVWFKAYVTVGSFNLLSQHSQLIDVELISPDDKVLQGIRLPLSAGISFGDFVLDSTLRSGAYRIRAYTQWMRNFDESYFFEKTIQLINPLENWEETTINTKTDSLHISIHPEGGYLSLGVPNKVVFQVKNMNGEPYATKGWLFGKNKEKLQEVTSAKNGLGEFIFIPEEDINYSISLTNGEEQSILLPTPKAGYGIALYRLTDSLLRVQLRMDPNKSEKEDLNLLIQQNGQVFYASKLESRKTDAIVDIPVSILGDGVNEITLFSANMKPYAYRTIFYTSPSRQLPIKLQTNKPTYSTREKVKVSVTSGFETDSFRVAALSAAVTHGLKVPHNEQEEDNILSYFLLKNSLNNKGQLSWSTVLNGEEDSQAIDNLMLTMGRDDVWENLDQVQVDYPIEKSMQISGWVTRLNEKKPVPFAKVILFSTEHALFLDTLADENGRFKFDRLFFTDSANFVLQARGEKGQKHLLIHLDSLQRHKSKQKKNSLEVSSGLKEEHQQYKENNTDRLQEMMRRGDMEKGIILSDVKVESKKKSHSSNLNGPGNADQVLDAKDLETCPSLEICLQGRLTGVIFQNGVPYSTRSMNIPMGLIVDGMQMEGSELSLISSMDVETIEVLRNAHYLSMYGSFGAGGIIIITTKRGDGARPVSNYTPGLVTYSPKGIYPTREFVSPDYSSDTQKYIEHDLRSTIFWKPNLVSDEHGNSSFDFFTSDQPGEYRIIVQGIDMYGKLAYSVLEFEVK